MSFAPGGSECVLWCRADRKSKHKQNQGGQGQNGGYLMQKVSKLMPKLYLHGAKYTKENIVE